MTNLFANDQRNLTVEEKQVIHQFLSDQSAAKSNKEIPKNIIENLFNNLITQHPNEKLDVVIELQLSFNGGNILITENLTESEFKNDWLSYSGDTRIILIEPSEFTSSETQPYDRQGVFYVPYSFSTLGEPKKIDDFIVYDKTLVNKGGTTHSRTVELNINDYWKTISYKKAVKKEEAIELLHHLLRLLGYSQTVINAVI